MKTWKVLLPLFMVIFVDVVGLCLVFPILAPLFYDPRLAILPASFNLPMRNFLYGLMLLMWPLFMFICAPILGDLSDRLGRKQVLLICLFGEAISYLLGAMAITSSSIIIFFLSRILSGAFSGSQPIAQAAIADISSIATKTRNMSNIVLASTLGVVLGPLLSGATTQSNWVTWFNATTPFQIAAITALLNAVLLMITFKETHEVRRTQKINIFKGLILLVEAFKDNIIRSLSLAFFASQLSWSLYFQSLAYFLVKQYHFSTAYIGIFYSVLGLASAMALTYGIRILLKLFKVNKSIFLIGSILQVLGAVLVFTSNLLAIQYLAVVVSGIGISFTYTVSLSMYSNQVSPERQGSIMGISAAVVGCAWAITALLSGLLSSINPLWSFFAAGVFAIMATLMMFKVRL